MTSIIGLKKFSLVIVAIGLGLGARVASGRENILLTVDATQTPQKMLHANLVIPVKPGPLTIYYPKWIPGNHSPSGPISSLTGLHFRRTGKRFRGSATCWMSSHSMWMFRQEWRSWMQAYDFIEPDGASATDKLFVLEWNEVTLYPAGSATKDLTYDATLILPEGWKFGTSLPIERETSNRVVFKPISLEMLVDGPVNAGEYFRVVDITPPGEPIHHELDLAADSEAALAISPAVKKGLTNVVAESGVLFGARHYRDYHFLLTLSDHVAHFGLEHHESNDSRLPERVLISPGAAFTVGSLLPHEFVHSWNGKYRRPADLTTPDFEKPMETDMLWGYEGLTDYLGPMLAARSGLWTPEQYREYLASIAASLGPGRPGRTWRPLLDTARVSRWAAARRRRRMAELEARHRLLR